MDIFTTAELVQVVPNLKLSQNWLLDRFFSNIVTAETEEVDIDVDVGKRRMSPFVSPLVQGKLVEQRRYQTNRYKPPYVKDLRAPDLRKPVRRMIGERIGGELTGEQRMMANIAFEMADQVDMLNRRFEWMAAQALLTSSVTVSGEGFESAVIDFGRDSGLTIALASGVKWTTTNIGSGAAVPSTDLRTWQTDILKASGAVARDVIFTNSSWEAFLQDPVVQKTIWYAGQGGAGNAVNVGAAPERGAVLVGTWGGFNLWLYNDWYVDDNDVEQPMLPAGTVTLCGPSLMGTRAFGMILDPEFNYGAMAYAPKMWIEKNPAQTMLLMQSAPLMIPSRVNASLSATVL